MTGIGFEGGIDLGEEQLISMSSSECGLFDVEVRQSRFNRLDVIALRA